MLVYIFIRYLLSFKGVSPLQLVLCWRVSQVTSYSKQARYMNFNRMQQDSNPERFSSSVDTQPFSQIYKYVLTIQLNHMASLTKWLNVFELSGCGFESRCELCGWSLDLNLIKHQAETYLGPCQISTMKLFCGNTERVNTVN